MIQNSFNAPWHRFYTPLELLERSDILPREIPLFGILLMVVENAVPGVAPESSISVKMGWDLVAETAMAYGLHRFHAHQTIQ